MCVLPPHTHTHTKSERKKNLIEPHHDLGWEYDVEMEVIAVEGDHVERRGGRHPAGRNAERRVWAPVLSVWIEASTGGDHRS